MQILIYFLSIIPNIIPDLIMFGTSKFNLDIKKGRELPPTLNVYTSE